TVESADIDCSGTGEAVAEDAVGDCDDTAVTINPDAAEIAGDEVDQDCDTVELCFVDADDDGFRPDETSTVESADIDCSGTGEAVAEDAVGDCDDATFAIHPGVDEIAGDGVDQDCDRTELCFVDADDDGFRPDVTATVVSTDIDCTGPGEAVTGDAIGDCDDTVSAINPDAVEIAGDEVDQDCDTVELCFVDVDDDGFRPDETTTVVSDDIDCQSTGEALSSDGVGDCEDTIAAINPDAVEIAGDEIDQDCDTAELCFVDVDDDGFRPDETSTVVSADIDCVDAGEAVVEDAAGDCDDTAAAINPGAAEIAGDEVDQDCDTTELCFVDADDDGYRPDETSTIESDDIDCAGAGEAVAEDAVGDCDDALFDIHPGADEIAGDEVDQDCDQTELCFVDADNDGYRTPDGSTVVSDDLRCNADGEALATADDGDCDDLDAAISPAASEVVADEIDQNCDGAEICYVDADNDGYRAADPETVESADATCDGDGEAPASSGAGDCDDTDAGINPGMGETPDNLVDENCDGRIDGELASGGCATLSSRSAAGGWLLLFGMMGAVLRRRR
ncbi:MAG: MopE-related protein, partial [Myxococcota bacterium]